MIEKEHAVHPRTLRGGLVNPPRRLRGAFGMCNLREGFVNLREGFVVAPWRLREAFSKTRPAKASRRRHGRLHLETIRQIMTSPLMFCTNCHKIDITTGYCSWVEIHPYKKQMEFSMLHRRLIFSFVYWYNRQVLLLLMICIYV